MRPDQHHRLIAAAARFFTERPTQPVADWCSENLHFSEPENRGPFNLAGRHYCAEPLQAFADPHVSDLVLVAGSQTGKTGLLMGGVAWTIVNQPSRCFWVMPTRPLVLGFSKTRWTPMLRASPATRDLIPSGAQRHDFAALQQQIGSSIVDFIWSNSPSALSSTPARVVILDEVDKFNAGGRREADAVSLAEQRTKDLANPLRIKTSTPTVTEGLIWQEWLKTDQRRRVLPCPHCKKGVLLGWSKSYTLLPITGLEAWITWDKEAKRADGSWDLDRVQRSARATCPHCAGHITDNHKPIMDANGHWLATSPAPAGRRGYHLPSLYATRPETTFGALAVKFLQAKHSLLGVQGFINGDLAECFESQDTRGERTELILLESSPLADSTALMTVDCQLVAPFFWYVIRDWQKTGDSRLRVYGHADTYDELRAIQLANKVADNHVAIDSGDDAQTVYDACLQFCRVVPGPGGMPLAVGWLPMKGFPRETVWKDPKTKLPRPIYLSSAGLTHRKFRLPLLLHSGPTLKDALQRLRRNQARQRWEVTNPGDDYWQHLDAERKIDEWNPRTRRLTPAWRLRSRHAANHLLDCEVEQLALAIFLGLLRWADTPGQSHGTP